MPKGVPLTEEDQNRRRHEIFGAAVKVFLKQGFHETSLRDIAEEAEIGKSTLYDYFPTKEDLLLWGAEDQLLDLSAEAREIAALPAPVTERLRQVMRNHVEQLLANKEFYLRLSFELQRLSMDAQKRIQVRRHAYQDVLRQLIDEGIADGTFRAVDSLTVARLLLVAATPSIYTSRPTGTPQEMLETAMDVVLKGITN